MSAARRYPMPCPGCRKRIDARDRLCPHCGIDTDAKLAPARTAVTFVALAAVVAAAALGGSGPWRYATACGLLLGLGAAWYASTRKRSRT